MSKEEIIYYLNNLVKDGEIYGVIECSTSETEATVEALREAIKLIKAQFSSQTKMTK